MADSGHSTATLRLTVGTLRIAHPIRLRLNLNVAFPGPQKHTCDVRVCRQESLEFVALVRVGKFRTGFLGDLICACINPLFGDS